MPSWFSDHLPLLFFDLGRPRRLPAGSTSLPRTDSAPAFPSSSSLAIPSLEDMNGTAGTGASRLSAPGNPINHQNSTARHVGDRPSDYFNTQRQQPPQVPHWPVIPNGFMPPNTLRMPEPHSHGVQQPTFVAPASYHTNSKQARQLLVPPPPPGTLSQQPLNSGPVIYPSQPQHPSQGLFNQAHHFIASGNFVDASITYNNPSSDQFMEKLLKETIPGAEFDSYARDPPPRCHPGTRLAMLDRCLSFVRTCNGRRKTRWVFGAAGVGKSAIMQSVVESPELAVSSHASVFFSVNGRDDGRKAVATISYQLAITSKPYRQLIEREITRDPALLRSSMAKQFFKLIIEPFIHNPQLNSAARVLIVIDGLDECKNPDTQLELLRLISDLCIECPSSPLVWLIASRPEQHITAFFSQSNVAAAYEKEEIVMDSDEAREDVERLLRAKLTEIKEKASDTVNPRWPEERDLWKLANAAGGLFAYADTAVRYIGDVNVGSPASQLSDVLNVGDKHPMTDVPQDHPMALLDALYARILSNVPSKVIKNARKLLLALAFDWPTPRPDSFVLLCNWLGMTPDDAYAALNHLRSVLRFPGRDEAHKEKLELFHKSFMDYISHFRRSGFSPNIKHEARQLMAQCVFRILNEAPDGIDFGDADGVCYGRLRRGPGTGDEISITWPLDKEVDGTDDMMRLDMYRLAIEAAVAGIGRGDPTFQNKLCIRILSTRFVDNGQYFPYVYNRLRDLVFDGSRRQEFMTHGILKQMPVQAVNISIIRDYEVKLQFRRLVTTTTNVSDPWDPFCKHKRKGKWREGDDQDWVAFFILYACQFCKQRLKRQVEYLKTRSPNHTVPTLFTSTGWCFVEFRFVDPKDGISEWTYWFWVILSSEERRMYGSTA